MTRRGSLVWPWVLVALWCCVIWGHSLMPGDDSSLESAWFVEQLRNFVGWLYASDNSFVRNLVAEHPGIISLLTDTERLTFYVRKGAHFTEYFVLGLLVLRAVVRTLRSLTSSVITLCMLWATVPGIDETIQRYVPGRAGMLRDVLIDMGGFGTAVAICLPFVALGSLFGRLRGSR